MGSARTQMHDLGIRNPGRRRDETLSLGPNSEKQALKIACLDPELTTIWSGFTGRPPDISERVRAMAARSSIMPMFGGYRVRPFWIAWMPACAAMLGVSKSGSPTLRSNTSSPEARRRLVSALIATVSEGLI